MTLRRIGPSWVFAIDSLIPTAIEDSKMRADEAKMRSITRALFRQCGSDDDRQHVAADSG